MAKIDFNNIQTMIGAGAVVNGPITLKGGIIIYGKVYGDIQTDGPLRITVSGQVLAMFKQSMLILEVASKEISQ
jgi:cytoskeletal protein CcmA (bactofilin family)